VVLRIIAFDRLRAMGAAGAGDVEGGLGKEDVGEDGRGCGGHGFCSDTMISV